MSSNQGLHCHSSSNFYLIVKRIIHVLGHLAGDSHKVPSPISSEQEVSINNAYQIPTHGNDCRLGTDIQCIEMYICFRLYVIGETNTDRQTYGFCPVANFFMHMFNDFNKSAKYQNVTNTLGQADFTIHALSSMHYLRPYKTQLSRSTQNGEVKKAVVLTKKIFKHHTSCTCSICL